MSNGDFRKFTDRELRAVQTAEDETARFDRQRKACRLNTWTDPITGMVCGRFQFDPETLRRQVHDDTVVDVSGGVDLGVETIRRMACDVPFDKCTIHHLDPWDSHGSTDLTNLRPTCSRHHHSLHEGGWIVQRDGWHDTLQLPDGTRIHAGPPRARAG